MELGIDIPNAILSTLMLILVMLGIAALFLGFFWLVYKASTIFYKWLSQRKFYIRLRQKCQEWWNKNKVSIISFWEFISEVLIDPAFYGYVLVTLYQRLQAISEYAKTYPEYSFWQLLDLDTRTHMQYYIVLYILFILWVIWRVRKHNQEVRFQEKIGTRLDKLNVNIRQNSRDIKQLTRNIGKLAEEIRKDREIRHGK